LKNLHTRRTRDEHRHDAEEGVPRPRRRPWWKKCAADQKGQTQITIVAITIKRRPNKGLPEKVATTSENTPNAGSIKM